MEVSDRRSFDGRFGHALHPSSGSEASHYDRYAGYGDGGPDWEEHLVEEVGDGKCRRSFLCRRTFKVEVRHHLINIQATDGGGKREREREREGGGGGGEGERDAKVDFIHFYRLHSKLTC